MLVSIICIISCNKLSGVHAFNIPPASIQASIAQHHQVYNTNNNLNNNLLRSSKDDDSESAASYYDDDENNSLLKELRDRKKETYGKDIPTNDELKKAAKDAENAFLAAMLEQTQQFKEIKSEKGGDAAVTEFRRRIQEEEVQRLEDDNAAVLEESIDKKWFVKQIKEKLFKESDEDSDAWQ